MIVNVHDEELVIGTKYKITDFNLVGEYDKYYGVFRGVSTCDGNYLKFKKVYNIFKRKNMGKLEFRLHYFRYYAFISDQPQWKMERRAVNLIVRRLIGDDNFEW